MGPSPDFAREQRRVALAMACAAAVTVAILGAVAMSDLAGPGSPFDARLRFAIRADLVVALWLAATVANVARLRFLSDRDIGGSSGDSGTTAVRQARSVLQNTLEQAALAVVAHWSVAATFRRSDALVGTLVALFALGRLLFWRGYRHGAAGRAFGFALTFYPSLAALLAAAVAILGGWAA